MTDDVLRLEIEPGKKFIINQAYVTVSEDGKAIEVDRDAAVLTEDHILTEQQASTPAARIYFYLQMMYLDPDNVDKLYVPFMDRMIDLLQATTLQPVKTSLMLVFRCVQAREFFAAMDACRELVIFEKELMREYDKAEEA
ncbi:MAG: flagellar biosynthesis repressor FlbT [Alphaproteobacteria bacterium]|nr:flagellar biosynthesis repressor FlbT [Alphaproteobacteria bacterium]